MKQSENLTQSAFSPRGGVKALCRADFNPLTTRKTIYGLDFTQIGKKCAFTLAEVLITLGIIGVVAAMTIPQLINDYKANTLRAQYLKAVSTFEQAQRWMAADNVLQDPLSYSSTQEWRQAFGAYLKGAVDCGARNGATSSPSKVEGCYNARMDNRVEFGRVPYRNMYGDATETNTFESGQFLLPGGMLFLFRLPNKQMSAWHPLLTTIDVNGYGAPPNRLGHDLFSFQWDKNSQKWLPLGAPGTWYTDMDRFCSESSTDWQNGMGCAMKASTDPDYFKWVVRTFK